MAAPITKTPKVRTNKLVDLKSACDNAGVVYETVSPLVAGLNDEVATGHFQTWLDQMRNIEEIVELRNESSKRMIIDQLLLQTARSCHNASVATERPFSGSLLALGNRTVKPDYVTWVSTNTTVTRPKGNAKRHVGSVWEIKRDANRMETGFVQIVSQLLIVGNGQDQPLNGVFSDGYEYIFLRYNRTDGTLIATPTYNITHNAELIFALTRITISGLSFAEVTGVGESLTIIKHSDGSHEYRTVGSVHVPPMSTFVPHPKFASVPIVKSTSSLEAEIQQSVASQTPNLDANTTVVLDSDYELRKLDFGFIHNETAPDDNDPLTPTQKLDDILTEDLNDHKELFFKLMKGEYKKEILELANNELALMNDETLLQGDDPRSQASKKSGSANSFESWNVALSRNMQRSLSFDSSPPSPISNSPSNSTHDLSSVAVRTIDDVEDRKRKLEQYEMDGAFKRFNKDA